MTEPRLFAPTEEAYERFRQTLKSYLYERIDFITLDFKIRDLINSEDDDSATRDQLASDLFKYILSFFGPRVRTEAPDLLVLNDLLKKGLKALYPGLFVLDELAFKASSTMMDLYFEEALEHTAVAALYQIGAKPEIRWIENDRDIENVRRHMNTGHSILTSSPSSSSSSIHGWGKRKGLSER